MNVQPLKSLVQSATKVRPLGCANFVSKPAITRTLEGEFKLATELIGDTCHFSHVDRSLEPNFLKGLLKIEGKDPMDTVRLIKDELLKAMGFKHTEALKLHYRELQGCAAAYDPITGTVSINATINMPKEELISTIRHELEHMNQFVKIYKAKGKDAFMKALLSLKKDNTLPDKSFNFIITRLFNERFYELMSKDVSLAGFDAEKYYKAMFDYVAYSKNKVAYYTHVFEKDAYAVESKVLEALGQDSTNMSEIYSAPEKLFTYTIEGMQKTKIGLEKNLENTINTKKQSYNCKDLLENINNFHNQN